MTGPGAEPVGEEEQVRAQNRSVVVEFLVDDVDETHARLGEATDVVT